MEDRSVHGSFFFVDIVGLSNPIITTKSQATKIQLLNKYISECESFRKIPKTNKHIIPTGDGMAICFFSCPAEAGLKLAIELQKKLAKYNKDKDYISSVKIRIGLNSGLVIELKDLTGGHNYWGSGIVLARRVMDLGKDRHILITDRLAEELIEFSDYYRKIIHPVDYTTVKHGKKILLYSAYEEGFGNATNPLTAEEEPIKTISAKIVVKLSDDDPTKAHYEEHREFQNLGDEPISQVLLPRLELDAPHLLKNINWKAYDEIGALSHTMIENKPRQKHFLINLRRPLDVGAVIRISNEFDLVEQTRMYGEKYAAEYDYFEITIRFKQSLNISPKFYERDIQARATKEIPPKLREQDGEIVIIKWAEKNPQWKGCQLNW